MLVGVKPAARRPRDFQQENVQRDEGFTKAATTAKQQPSEDRNVVPRTQTRRAGVAMRRRRDNRFASPKPIEDERDKRTERRTERRAKGHGDFHVESLPCRSRDAISEPAATLLQLPQWPRFREAFRWRRVRRKWASAEDVRCNPECGSERSENVRCSSIRPYLTLLRPLGILPGLWSSPRTHFGASRRKA